ncbi:hypothetical protein C4B63_60g136 [Trypanosoma cruzi]|uniref:Las1-like n=1 Tax=Trypanosoma cruzi TaxID=5693 RepID=A0A2V2UYE1_TRYCR|nr:hypothetical protein C4B63_60g136 [Trypanosoma cruzi]
MPTNMARKRSRAWQNSPNEKRKRGTCIKSGLGELGDLDAVAPTGTSGRISADVSNTKAVGAASAEGEFAFSTAPFLSLSRSAPSVFGHGWGEWKRVKQMLFDPQDGTGLTEARRKALNRIQLVWKARERKNRQLPAYAEATALLMEAFSLDEGDKLSSLGAVSFYGAAISRAVHLMTGSFARGAADTYRKRARLIGFPEEAVEVRQRVAHGALPLLSELRWVCGLVLQFLFHHYWVEQERHVHLMEEETEGEEDNATSGHEVRQSAPSATVEEMRQLLEDLSDVGEDVTDYSKDRVEFLQDGWQLC